MKSSGKKGEWDGVKIVAQNRSASYNYTLSDNFEAGMVLVGTEVKSLREGKGGLREAYADVKGEVWLINCHIPEYTSLVGFAITDPLSPPQNCC